MSAFSVGPLGPPITLLPLSMYLITKRSLANRFSVLDGLVICLLFISLGAFLGARMHFYSLTLLSIILTCHSSVNTNCAFCSISLCAVVGIWVGYNFDKCGDFKRMENHFQIFKFYYRGQAKQWKQAQSCMQIANLIPTPTACRLTQCQPHTCTLQVSLKLEKTPTNQLFIDRVKTAQDCSSGKSGKQSKMWRMQIWNTFRTHGLS